jgi:cephalosporin hydroxylase
MHLRDPDRLRRLAGVLEVDRPPLGRALRRLARPMRPDYRRRLSMTLRQWLLHHQRDTLFERCTWMGIPAQKNPLDAWIYQEILHEVRPEVVVEIGSAQGGSALFLAHMLDLIGDGGEVISIDIDRSRFRPSHPRLHVLTGDAASPAVVAEAAALARGRRTLVIQDGDHKADGVLRDLRAYADFVSPGSYLIVEDGIIDLFRPGDAIADFHPGPLAAIERFLLERPDFEVDAARERYILTASPRGFLKRRG